MKRQWTDEELEAHFTLQVIERDLVADSKTDHNLLGFAVLLKCFQEEGRFPSHKQDIPAAVTRHLAHQLGVAPEALLVYDWDGRTMMLDHAAIRTFLGTIPFRGHSCLRDPPGFIGWKRGTHHNSPRNGMVPNRDTLNS